MTTVWILSNNTADFNTLSVRDERYGTFPRLDGAPELSTWVPQQVWYDPLVFRQGRALANLPAWSVHTVGDTLAKAVIQELIGDHVEFLPLDFQAPVGDGSLYSPEALRSLSEKQYYVINVLTTLDCLDFDQSEFTYFESTGGIRSIRKRVFKPDCIGDTPIFKLPILNRVTTYVTDSFKQLVEDNNLTGLEFRKVWEG
ncbi:MAG: hypothetical protein OXG60_17305 [Chloroflexi bacterium]|nr:hypothetical protein [Chloroflexota bacterium]